MAPTKHEIGPIPERGHGPSANPNAIQSLRKRTLPGATVHSSPIRCQKSSSLCRTPPLKLRLDLGVSSHTVLPVFIFQSASKTNRKFAFDLVGTGVVCVWSETGSGITRWCVFFLGFLVFWEGNPPRFPGSRSSAHVRETPSEKILPQQRFFGGHHQGSVPTFCGLWFNVWRAQFRN